MTFSRPTIDSSYRAYADLLLRRHRLLGQGKDKGEEIAEVEDGLSALWEDLDEAQRQSLNGMGSDLNWARRRGTPAPMARKAHDVREADREALTAAIEAKDAHAVLFWLRCCASSMPLAELAERRQQAYASTGFPQVADVFGDLIRGGNGHPSHSANRLIEQPNTKG